MWKKLFLTFFVFSFLFIVMVLGFAVFMVAVPPNGADTRTVTITIERGESTRAIAQRLYDVGLIRSPFLFRMLVFFQRNEAGIQTGSFDLKPSLSMTDVAAALHRPARDVWVTLKEGWRAEEMAQAFAAVLNPNTFSSQDFIVLAHPKEGK